MSINFNEPKTEPPLPIYYDKEEAGNEATEAIDKAILSWLSHTPPSDINFRSALAQANAATIRAALAYLNGRPETKTAIKALQIRLRKLEKQAKGQA